MDFKAGTLSKVDRIKEAKKDLYPEKKKIEPLAVVVEKSKEEVKNDNSGSEVVGDNESNENILG